MAILKETVFGNLKVQIGTYSSASTTATITTGFKYVAYASLVSAGSATCPYVTSGTSGTVTATTASSDTGTYMIIGL